MSNTYPGFMVMLKKMPTYFVMHIISRDRGIIKPCDPSSTRQLYMVAHFSQPLLCRFHLTIINLVEVLFCNPMIHQNLQWVRMDGLYDKRFSSGTTDPQEIINLAPSEGFFYRRRSI